MVLVAEPKLLLLDEPMAGMSHQESGKVVEFKSDEIEKLQIEIARKLGYRLIDHRLGGQGRVLADAFGRRRVQPDVLGHGRHVDRPTGIALVHLAARRDVGGRLVAPRGPARLRMPRAPNSLAMQRITCSIPALVPM